MCNGRVLNGPTGPRQDRPRPEQPGGSRAEEAVERPEVATV